MTFAFRGAAGADDPYRATALREAHDQQPLSRGVSDDDLP